MTSDLDRLGVSAGDRARARAYLWDLSPGMISYGVVLTGVILWGGLNGHSPWRYLWALLPVLPAAWILRAVARHARRIDDYQRLLLLQRLAIGFGAAMLAAVTIGFLGIAGLAVPAAGWIIYGVGMLTWALTAAAQNLSARG